MNPSEIVKMSYIIQDFLIQNNLGDAKPKDLIPVLIEKGYFKNDHRYGLHLLNVLRELDEKNLLYLLPQVRVERKEKNRYWFFNVVEI
ncbi:hypothetical protein JCM19275_3169 [Nonlabens ulvanivorans]|uniref:Uncharacterized protein n=1 Tax=Nonlabens ulvanivorans TaxID=906888 RepID=A0A090WFX4_NONUL|nr:hypothetical protein JCM19275_3169 [Nonlabens ulvanivorans]